MSENVKSLQSLGDEEAKTIVQMAKRLRLNLHKLENYDSCAQEFWGNPWSDLVRSLYEKRFGVRSL